MSKPTVVIVDDDQNIRRQFTRLIEHDGRLQHVGSAHDGRHGVTMVQRLQPNIAIMDLRMPILNGVDATREIVDSTDTSVLAITTFDLDRDALAAIHAGASGFLLKFEAPHMMVDASLSILEGEQVLNPLATRALISHLINGKHRSPELTNVFSVREGDVLTEVVTGASNEEIAERLFISVSTVRSHIRSMIAKVEVQNRTQLVVWAYENGFVRPSQQE